MINEKGIETVNKKYGINTSELMILVFLLMRMGYPKSLDTANLLHATASLIELHFEDEEKIKSERIAAQNN